MNDSVTSVRPRHELPRWYEWLAGGLLLLVAFGYFVVRPAAERLIQGLGSVAVSFAQGAAKTATRTHELACQAIEQDPAVRDLLEGEIACAPVEAVTWLSPRDGETLEFEFSVTSDSGKQAMAIVRAKLRQDGPEMESIVVNGESQSVLLLPLPQ